MCEGCSIQNVERKVTTAADVTDTADTAPSYPLLRTASPMRRTRPSKNPQVSMGARSTTGRSRMAAAGVAAIKGRTSGKSAYSCRCRCRCRCGGGGGCCGVCLSWVLWCVVVVVVVGVWVLCVVVGVWLACQ